METPIHIVLSKAADLSEILDIPVVAYCGTVLRLKTPDNPIPTCIPCLEAMVKYEGAIYDSTLELVEQTYEALLKGD